MSQATDTLAALQAAVTNEVTVVQSAVTLINGIGAKVKAAVDAALANGATAEQLAPITDEITSLNTSATALAAAVQANTPAMPATP